MAAQFCSQCGREVSTIAQFCPGCGNALGNAIPLAAGARPVQPRAAAVDTVANTTQRWLLPLAIVAALVMTIVAVIALGALRSRAVVTAQTYSPPPATSVLAAPTEAPVAAPPITNAPTEPATPAPALTNAPTQPSPEMPADVADYLKFLQGIEARRVSLDHDFESAGAMMATAQSMESAQSDSDPDQHNDTETNGVNQLNQGFAQYVDKFNDLSHDFSSRQPPAACQPLATAYYQFLTDYVATISKLQVALQNHDLGAAMGAQGSQTQINSEAVSADGALGDLCSSYHVSKPFAIQSDNASSPVVGI